MCDASLAPHVTDESSPPTALERMLANRVYLGEVRHGEFVNASAH